MAQDPSMPKDDGRVKLTADRLRALLRYDLGTGVFTRRISTGGQAAGSIAGTTRKDGRRQISIDGNLYLASRLAWLYVHGDWPKDDIDHEDRHRSNDVFSNLRDAAHPRNVANRAKFSGGRSRFLGVHPKRNRWDAAITVDGVRHRLGVFESEEDAARARDAASAAMLGKFAVLNFARGA